MTSTTTSPAPGGAGAKPATQAVAAHAKRLGVEEDRVRQVALNLQKLRDEGTLVALHIHGTTLFTRSVSWDELGITPKDKRRKRFSTGSKHLIDPKLVNKLRGVENALRQSLERYSFDIEGFKPYRYVPCTAFDEWEEKYEQHVAEFNAIRDEIIADYDKHVKALETTFADIGASAWDSLPEEERKRLGDGVANDLAKIAFVKNIVTRAQAAMPTREQIREKVTISYDPAVVLGMADVKADLFQAERLEKAAAEERAVRAVAEAKEAKAKQETQAIEDERQAKIAAMKQAELERARQRLATIADPMEEMYAQLQTFMLETTDAALETLKKHSAFVGRSRERLSSMIARFRLLNVMGDQELETLLGDLDKLLKQQAENVDPRKKPSIGDIRGKIRDVQKEARRDVTKLARQARSASMAAALEVE